jgi:hypothetical protein
MDLDWAGEARFDSSAEHFRVGQVNTFKCKKFTCLFHLYLLRSGVCGCYKLIESAYFPGKESDPDMVGDVSINVAPLSPLPFVRYSWLALHNAWEPETRNAIEVLFNRQRCSGMVFHLGP